VKSKAESLKAKLTLKFAVECLKVSNLVFKLRSILQFRPNFIECLNLLARIIKVRLQIIGLRLELIAVKLRLFKFQFQLGYFQFQRRFLTLKFRLKRRFLAFKKLNMVA